MEDETQRLLDLRTRQLRTSREGWCKAAEAALAAIPGASNSTHPAYDLWLRVQMHRAPPMEIVLSA